VRVEALEPAVDHVLDQLPLAVLIELADIAGVDLRQHFDHEPDKLVILVLLADGGTVRDGEANQKNGRDAN
jgi:hypothetical protein